MATININTRRFNLARQTSQQSNSNSVQDSSFEQILVDQVASEFFPAVLLEAMATDSDEGVETMAPPRVSAYVQKTVSTLTRLLPKNEFYLTSEGRAVALESSSEEIQNSEQPNIITAEIVEEQSEAEAGVQLRVASEELPDDLEAQTVSQQKDNTPRDFDIPALIGEKSSGIHTLPDKEKPAILAILSQDISKIGYPKSTTIFVRRLLRRSFEELSYEIYRKDLFNSNEFELIDTIDATEISINNHYSDFIKKTFPQLGRFRVMAYTDNSIETDKAYLYKIRLNFAPKSESSRSLWTIGSREAPRWRGEPAV